jgi:hypothetical protein
MKVLEKVKTRPSEISADNRAEPSTMIAQLLRLSDYAGMDDRIRKAQAAAKN